MSDEERENKKLKFSESIDLKFKQAEKEVEDLQKSSRDKQKELHEKFNTN
jgi:flagellar capping protein FliD